MAVNILCIISISLGAQSVPWTVPAISMNSVPLKINCIPEVEGQQLSDGDYLGIFNDLGECFGLARWKDTNDFRVIVYGSDGTIDGFTAGEGLNLKIWLRNENCVLEHISRVESDNPLVYTNTLTNRITVLNFDRLSVTFPREEYCQNDAVLKPVLSYQAGGLSFTSTGGLAIDGSTGTVDPRANNPGTYTISISSGTCLANNTVRLTLNAVPQLSPMPDTFICGEMLMLSAPEGYRSVSWSTGAMTNQVELRQPSTVWYRVTNDKGCSNADTFRVDKTSLVSVDYLIHPADCYEKGSLQINGNVVTNGRPPYAYRLTNTINNVVYDDMHALPEGMYDLEVINSNGCVLKHPQGIVIRKDCLEDTPVFTPNDDGMDDRFFIEFEGVVRIFDRNGTLKRRLAGPLYFDGLDESGNPLPMGTYLVVSEKGQTITLTVIR